MRILVIEDEEGILSFVSRGLAAKGYAVEGATDGRQGLELGVRGGCDLVVLDLSLPALNGFDVLSGLAELRPELPVIVLSARSDLATKLRGFDLGAVDYMAKPFALDELLARVRAHLMRAKGAVDTGSVVHGTCVDLDVARRQAVIGDERRDLADREFHVLFELLAHEGEVVSREQLLAKVWGYAFDPGSNVVEVCIRRLRKRLGPEVAIETVRHAGYRLAA
ncbi:MAG: response regulator transcription factor [Actinobacteria bacterium]|nr:response regulator transcription factor [Actinomycetota bacterium]